MFIWFSTHFLIIIVTFEILLLIKEKIGIIAEIIVSFIILILLAWLLHCDFSDFLIEEKPLSVIFYTIICPGIPILLIVIGNQSFAKIESVRVKHICLLFFSVLGAFISPSSFLLLSCHLGLGCI